MVKRKKGKGGGETNYKTNRKSLQTGKGLPDAYLHDVEGWEIENRKTKVTTLKTTKQRGGGETTLQQKTMKKLEDASKQRDPSKGSQKGKATEESAIGRQKGFCDKYTLK